MNTFKELERYGVRKYPKTHKYTIELVKPYDASMRVAADEIIYGARAWVMYNGLFAIPIEKREGETLKTFLISIDYNIKGIPATTLPEYVGACILSWDSTPTEPEKNPMTPNYTWLNPRLLYLGLSDRARGQRISDFRYGNTWTYDEKRSKKISSIVLNALQYRLAYCGESPLITLRAELEKEAPKKLQSWLKHNDFKKSARDKSAEAEFAKIIYERKM